MVTADFPLQTPQVRNCQTIALLPDTGMETRQVSLSLLQPYPQDNTSGLFGTDCCSWSSGRIVSTGRTVDNGDMQSSGPHRGSTPKTLVSPDMGPNSASFMQQLLIHWGCAVRLNLTYAFIFHFMKPRENRGHMDNNSAPTGTAQSSRWCSF